MNGVPIRVFRDGQFETAWLWCGRSGDQGKRIRTLSRECDKLEQRWIMAQRKVILSAMQVEKDDAMTLDQIEALSERQAEAITEATELKAALTDTTAQLALAALEPNYGPEEATRIMDLLTDTQIRQIPRVLDTGREPPDFFPESVIRPSANATSPAAGSPAASPSTGESPLTESDPETTT